MTQPDSPVRAVWWRSRRLDTDVPRCHGVGWALTDASRHGHLALRTESRTLPDALIEQLLAVELASQLGELELNAYPEWTEASPAVRILVENGQIIDADLHSHYGNNTLAGITCDVRSDVQDGVTAWVVLDNTLSAEQRSAALDWAATEVYNFPTSTSENLIRRGWRRQESGRWQVLRYAAEPTPAVSAQDSGPLYTATATLIGPIQAEHAEQILDRLRDFSAAFGPQDHTCDEPGTSRIDLHFTLSADSRQEAVMRALSLSDDLGYRLQHLTVLPA